ncbi:MAG: Gfo/Idh/MocA family oxidoreductase [Candidatus Hydrogenedentes bacterium]|nr:Gfo/Idh/MocA family oxidoreductase [Candidatus Hydrogenedentota bacterium]
MDVTRRNFMKAAGTTAGVMIATGWSPLSYAQNEKVRLAMIGTGSQNRIHIEQGIAGNPQIEVVAMSDCLLPSLAGGLKTLIPDPKPDDPDDKKQAIIAKQNEFKPHCYLNYKDMLAKEKDNIDAVLIATPFKTHYQIVMDCLDAGKHVFCEKTLADTVERCRNIVTKCHETGKFVQCGHQRRYNPEYIHLLQNYLDGRAGRIQYIEGQWHRYGDWKRPMPRKIDPTDPAKERTIPYELSEAEKKLIPDLAKMVNWRVYEEYSAGLISELATHHIELVNWVLGMPPTRVMATGGIDYWKDDRDTFDNIVIVFEYDIKRSRGRFRASDPKASGNQLEPTALIAPYTVRFNWTGTLQSSLKSEGVLFVGEKGTFEMHERNFDGSGRGSWYQPEPVKIWLDPATMQETKDEKIIAWIKSTGQSQKYSRLVDQPLALYKDELGDPAYVKNPDVLQFEAFAECVKTGTPPRTNQMCGLMASICDIAAHEAATKKEVVTIDPAWYTFDFETPDPFVIA